LGEFRRNNHLTEEQALQRYEKVWEEWRIGEKA
jgi:hypothetical protein